MSSCKTTVTLTETNNLGGPFRGYSAPQTKSGFKTAEQVISRRVLRDSWNNAPADGTVSISKLKNTSVTSNKIIGLDAGKLSGSLSGSGVNLTNINAASITGTLPAIDGSALTGVSAYENETSDPTATENKTLGTMWVNKTSGEMYILTDDTTNANVWTNVGDGTGTQPFTGMVATGGTITTNGDYKVHTFNNSGTFTVTSLGTDAEVEYLVIAGGGGGSRRSSAGGDGGGGLTFAQARVQRRRGRAARARGASARAGAPRRGRYGLGFSGCCGPRRARATRGDQAAQAGPPRSRLHDPIPR